MSVLVFVVEADDKVVVPVGLRRPVGISLAGLISFFSSFSFSFVSTGVTLFLVRPAFNDDIPSVRGFESSSIMLARADFTGGLWAAVVIPDVSIEPEVI